MTRLIKSWMKGWTHGDEKHDFSFVGNSLVPYAQSLSESCWQQAALGVATTG